MPSLNAKNMASKQYCPKCGSFNMRRLHRGYISKRLLNKSPQYMCLECKSKSTEEVLEQNDMKKMPAFLEGDH